MSGVITYTALAEAIAPHFGTYDVACPLCGPDRRRGSNRSRKVFRVWYTSPGFMTYSCARCGTRGYARANGGEHTLPASLPDRRCEAKPTPAMSNEARRDKARWLWSCRQSIEGTLAEIYLRKARAYGGTLPATLGFLRPRGEHLPGMIGAAGAASFMPALAAAVPGWVECVTILVDDDKPGRWNADELARRLERRGFSVRLIVPPQTAARYP